jgi:hypothetical protein
MGITKDENVIKALAECIAECNRCLTACLDEPEVGMLTRCIKLNMDCAEICALTITYIARDSEHTFQVRDECEEICLHCAHECEKHTNMEHCMVCAEVCRHCAEICRVL